MDDLAQLDDESVQCVVTSPPYWRLRDYGVEGQLGFEATPDEYLSKMVDVFREVRRVLRPDGTVWLNMGDTYNSIPGGYYPDGIFDRPSRGAQRIRGLHRAAALKPKDLIGIPWRLALGLQADGWWLRSDIIWHKPNPMPESVTDRPTKSHEYVFLLTKSAKYYYDAEAVREPAQDWGDRDRTNWSARINAENYGQTPNAGGEKGDFAESGRNLRDVWTIPTQPYLEAHFATFPEKLVEPCIKAGTAKDDTVLDPFCGSGATGVVALRLGRKFIGMEINPEYCEMARNRINDDAPLFNRETVCLSAETVQTKGGETMSNDVLEALKTKLQDIGEVKAAKKMETAHKITAAGPEFYNTVEAGAELAVLGMPDETDEEKKEKAIWLQFAKVIIAAELLNFLVTD